jgi:hypothetical protein
MIRVVLAAGRKVLEAPRAANQGPYETNLRRMRVTAWMLFAETLAEEGWRMRRAPRAASGLLRGELPNVASVFPLIPTTGPHTSN